MKAVLIFFEECTGADQTGPLSVIVSSPTGSIELKAASLRALHGICVNEERVQEC